MYRKSLIHKPHSPKLWEEEWDETELDFVNHEETVPDTNIISMNRKMVRRIISENLNPSERKVIEAFMEGRTYKMVGVTERHWRYHFRKALEVMRKLIVDNPKQFGVKYHFNGRIYG
jgi:hypothetical protein